MISPYSLVFNHFHCLCYFELGLKINIFNKYINRDCHNEMFGAVYSQTQAVLEWLNNSNYGWMLYGYCNCLQTQRYAELWVNLRNPVMWKYKNVIKMPKSLYCVLRWEHSVAVCLWCKAFWCLWSRAAVGVPCLLVQPSPCSSLAVSVQLRASNGVQPLPCPCCLAGGVSRSALATDSPGWDDCHVQSEQAWLSLLPKGSMDKADLPFPAFVFKVVVYGLERLWALM